MSRYLQVALFSIASLLSLNVQSGDAEKKFSLGVGSYALTVAYENPVVGSDDEFGGLGLVGTYAFTDSFAIRGEYYSLGHDQVSSLKARGFDLVGHIGTRLATQGFKAYVGGGLFSETWEFFSAEEDFSGLQFNGGIGYNWESVSLDFVLGIRDPSDYEDFILRATGITTTAVAVSGSLMLSARF